MLGLRQCTIVAATLFSNCIQAHNETATKCVCLFSVILFHYHNPKLKVAMKEKKKPKTNERQLNTTNCSSICCLRLEQDNSLEYDWHKCKEPNKVCLQCLFTSYTSILTQSLGHAAFCNWISIVGWLLHHHSSSYGCQGNQTVAQRRESYGAVVFDWITFQ